MCSQTKYVYRTIMEVIRLTLLVILLSCHYPEPLGNDIKQELYRFGDVPNGPLEDATCNIETIEEQNHEQLNTLLTELINTTFFRLFKVNLSAKCPFWKTKEEVENESCGSEEKPADTSNPVSSASSLFGATINGGEKEEKPTLCSIETNRGKKLPWGPTSSPVVQSSFVEENVSEGCKDSRLPEFWLDLCPKTDFTKDSEYVDLLENPEQYTGYNGTRLWDAIYQENCFSRQLEAGREPVMGEMCYEERVLYRLFSGMHSAINIQISLNFYPPRKGKRTQWEPNPQRYFDLFDGHPERIKNLHFAFVVLLRALKKASTALDKFPISIGDEDKDVETQKLMQRLLDTHILKSCGPLFSAFDESKLFQEGNGPAATTELKYQFKGVFRNVTKILDCVTCQKCKLHGKLAIKGLGTALTILLVPEKLVQKSLFREDIVSLINTIAKFSDAIINYKKLANLAFDMQKQKMNEIAEETKAKDIKAQSTPKATLKNQNTVTVSSDKEDVAFDIILGMVSKLAMMGKLTAVQEDILVDSAIAQDNRLKSLIKHYAVDPERFVRHALRIISNNPNIDTSLSERSTNPSAIIIGSGLSGLTAALTLVDRGARVVIIEKQAFMGGNSAYASSGINAAINSTTDISDEDDNAIKFAQDSFKSSEMSENLEHPSNKLIPVLTSHSFDALEWARNRVSVDLNKVGQLGGHSYPRTYRPSTGMAGSELIFAISKIVKSFAGTKVELKMKTSAKEILVDTNGNAIGVKVQVEGKEEDEDLFADNVIIATGGYANDHTSSSLLDKYRPDLNSFATTNGKFATGDGHKMAISAGANMVDMENVQVHPTAFIDLKFPDASRKTLCAEILRGLGGILLNQQGERFVDELGTRKHIVESMQAQGNANLHFTILLSPEMASQADKHVPHYHKKGLLEKFESLEDVANWMKVNLKTLEDTLDAYNEFAVSGSDKFGKKHFKNTPFPKQRLKLEKEEYFYAGIVTPALHYCMGGISIDGSGHVLKDDGTIFNGLYAAGEVTGGLHGVNRLGGNALTECIVFGRVVGEVIEINEEESVSDENGGERSIENTGLNSKKLISQEELAKHNSAKDCWVSIDNKIYDLTDFLEEHPSGPQPILDLAGKDGTEVFDDVHTRAMLDDFDIIGELDV